MITQETVLILGAGVSMAYGFPSGQKLKALIWKKLENCGDEFIYAMGMNAEDYGHKHQFDEMVKDFRSDLLLSPDYSIDSFLEHHNDNYRKLGKIGIASVLLPLEKRQYLFDEWMQALIDKNEHPDIRLADGHWYQYLFNHMFKNCKKVEDFSNNKVSIITFNYDRSLEYYLLTCLQAKYKKGPIECAKVIQNIPVLHVYGKLGDIPELSSHPEDAIPYSNLNRNLIKFLQIAEKSIKIINDPNANTSPEFQEAQKLINKATNIYFLGFGFLGENMRRLFTDYSTPGIEFGLLKDTPSKVGIGRKCFGTMLGISPHHKDWLAQKGLSNLQDDLIRRDTNTHSFHFPNSTIYDFLFYNVYTRFD
jgi:hypothetical protein